MESKSGEAKVQKVKTGRPCGYFLSSLHSLARGFCFITTVIRGHRSRLLPPMPKVLKGQNDD